MRLLLIVMVMVFLGLTLNGCASPVVSDGNEFAYSENSNAKYVEDIRLHCAMETIMETEPPLGPEADAQFLKCIEDAGVKSI